MIANLVYKTAKNTKKMVENGGQGGQNGITDLQDAKNRKSCPQKTGKSQISWQIFTNKASHPPNMAPKGSPQKTPKPTRLLEKWDQEADFWGQRLGQPFETPEIKTKMLRNVMSKTTSKQQRCKGWKQQKTLRGLATIKEIWDIKASKNKQKYMKF